MPRSNKIKLSRESAFSVEFTPSRLTKEPGRTDVTIYRWNHGTSQAMTLKQMRHLRNRLTREIDRQADMAMNELRCWEEAYNSNE